MCQSDALALSIMKSSKKKKVLQHNHHNSGTLTLENYLTGGQIALQQGRSGSAGSYLAWAPENSLKSVIDLDLLALLLWAIAARKFGLFQPCLGMNSLGFPFFFLYCSSIGVRSCLCLKCRHIFPQPPPLQTFRTFLGSTWFFFPHFVFLPERDWGE